MNTETLIRLGLTEAQAKAYICLIKEGRVTPPTLAALIKETRSNTYKILDQLMELGLVKRREENKKFVYRPESPVALEQLARERRNEVLSHERHVKDAMPTLLNYFYTFSDQPGIRFFQGKEGLKEVFTDMLRTRKDTYLLRSPADVAFYGEKFYEEFRKKRARLGIKTYALTPNVSSAVHNPQIDRANKFIRTWLPKGSYDASVEWNIYGNKVALISYGEEAMATIIESPQIADSFRQVFNLLHRTFSGNPPAKKTR